MTYGKIHSWESMGLVDGPGIRTVVFLQGCKLRCRYCHNPDTWCLDGGHEESADDVVKKLTRFKPYFKKDGGVTFSGGEPLLQREFLIDVLQKCHDAGINTCLDTAGCGNGGYREILIHTDLLLLDIKHYTEEGYKAVTGRSMDEFNSFLAVAQEMNIPLWIRHVVVPGLTDSPEHLEGLQSYIQTLKNVQRVELLPYHVLGVHKYHTMNIPYTLEGVPAMDQNYTAAWQEKMKER